METSPFVWAFHLAEHARPNPSGLAPRQVKRRTQAPKEKSVAGFYFAAQSEWITHASMHRWMLQGLAFTCLAVAGLAAANKPASAMVSAAGPSLLGTKGARHGCDQPDRTAMELPTKYRDRRADVSFAGRMTAGPTVTVGGQVRQPGPVKLGTAANLWSAIQRAGGATEFGAINRVRLTREQLVKEYDMRNPEHRAIPLSDRDTIEVPQKSVIGR